MAWGILRFCQSFKVWIVEGRGLIPVFFLLAFIALSPANAQEHRLDADVFTGFERNDIATNDDPGLGSQTVLRTAYVGDLRGRYQWFLSGHDQLSVAAQFRTDRYLNAEDRSTNLLRGIIEYRFEFGPQKRGQVRLRAEPSYEERGGFWLRTRIRGRAEMLYRVRDAHSAFAWFQAGHQDYNESRTQGYDQFEYRAELGHEFRDRERGLRIVSAAIYERANAKRDRFDFSSVGADLRSQYEISERTDLLGRIQARYRTFDGPFAAADTRERIDRQYRVTIGAQHRFFHYFSALGEFGWEANNSNISARDVEGFVFRLGVLAKY